MFNNLHKLLNSSLIKIKWLIIHGSILLPWYQSGNSGISDVKRDDQLIIAIQVQAADAHRDPCTHVGLG